jgi:hypothetical protein
MSSLISSMCPGAILSFPTLTFQDPHGDSREWHIAGDEQLSPKYPGVTPRSKSREAVYLEPTLLDPTSFLARLATHACLSASSWSFRAFSSIWRVTGHELPEAPYPRAPPILSKATCP